MTDGRTVGPTDAGPRPTPRAPRTASSLWVLLATAFVDMLGFAIVFPLLPFYAQSLDATPLMIGVLISSFSVAQLATAPMWGRLSDRYGRKPILLIGLSAAGLAFIVFGLAHSYWMLLISRTVQGAGGGTTGVIQAYVGDSTDPKQRARALGWISAATSTGVMIGPVIGSAAAHIGPWAPGFVAAFLCLCNVIFAWKLLPESRPAQARPERRIREALWHVLRHPFEPQPRLIWIYAIGMGAFTAMSAVVALYLNARFGVDETTIGYVFMYIGAIAVLMRAVVLGWLVDRLGETRVMRIGAMIFAAGLLLYTMPSSLWMMALVLPVVPIGQALLFPSVTALSSHRSDKRELGQMMGVQQAFGGTSRVVSPLWATWVFQQAGPRYPFLVAAVIMMAVSLLTFRVSEQRGPSTDDR